MFEFLKSKHNDKKAEKAVKNYENEKALIDLYEKNQGKGLSISSDLYENVIQIKELFDLSADLNLRELILQNGKKVAIFSLEGMVNKEILTEAVLKPLTVYKGEATTSEELFNDISGSTLASLDQMYMTEMGTLLKLLMSGFTILLLEGVERGIAIGLQGFPTRGVSEPQTEQVVRGSREGFVETLRMNMALIRKRVKSPSMKFEIMTVGKTSQTDICLCYLRNIASKDILDKIRTRISDVNLDMVLEGGYLRPFLQKKPYNLFSGIGITERPDTLCGKISEGRIGILVDGTPFALIVPYLFEENFQAMDDYANQPFYATFSRLLRYGAFFISFLLPGLYVAITTFHEELFPSAVLYNVAKAEANTPLPLVQEALIIHILFEIMREAGLRLPKQVGHTIGIIGGLILGDAAISAGLIGAPMVIIVAITGMCSFILPTLYNTIAVLRIVFIIVGGTLGLYGMIIVLCVVLANICALNNFGVPYSSPLTPFRLKSMRDIFVRENWRKMSKHKTLVQNMPGSEDKN